MGDQLETPAGRAHDRRTRRRRRSTAVGVAVTAALALTACAGDDDDSAADRSEEPAPDFTSVAAETDDSGEGADAATAGTAPAGASDLDLGIVGRDVIIELHVVLSSDDIGRSVASISASASQLGGGVASSSVDYGDPTAVGPTGHAVLVVKVPPDQLDRLLSGLDATGVVRSIEQSAQDVTEQLVDLDVRIENARESVANVRDFMERASDLNQLVTLESELTARQTELERLEAQQRNLSERVGLSTVTIEVVPTSAVPDPVDEDESLVDAVRDGWQAFATVLFAIVYLLAVLMPFLLVAAAVGAVAWWVVRRRRRTTAGSAPTSFDEPDRDDREPADALSGDGSANRPA